MLRRLRRLFGQPSPKFRPTFHAGQRDKLAAYDGHPFEVLRYVCEQERGELWLIRFPDGTEVYVEPECVEDQTSRP